MVTYLSFAPKGLKCALITGGLPPIGKGCTADAVYRACFEQILHQNEKYYKRFPQDVEVVREVVNHLTEVEGGKASIHSSSWPLGNAVALLTNLVISLTFSFFAGAASIWRHIDPKGIANTWSFRFRI